MDEQDYKDALEAIRFQLHDGKERTVADLRKSDPEIIKANIRHGNSLNGLGANYRNLRRGPVSDAAYARERAEIDRNRDEVENQKIRPGFIKAREQMLNDAFEDHQNRLLHARKDLDKDISLQWLRDPEQEKEKSLEDISEEKSDKAVEEKNIPGISARFNDVSEKDYHKTSSRFNRAAKNDVHARGYPDASPPEGRKNKDDLQITKDYSAGKEFPGFDDYTPPKSDVEPSKDGPEIDISNK